VTLGGGIEDGAVLEGPIYAVDAVLGIVSGAAVAALSAMDPHLPILLDYGVLRACWELTDRGHSPRHAVRAVLNIAQIS
jgi:hypothetical protein